VSLLRKQELTKAWLVGLGRTSALRVLIALVCPNLNKCSNETRCCEDLYCAGTC